MNKAATEKIEAMHAQCEKTIEKKVKQIQRQVEKAEQIAKGSQARRK